MGAGDGIDQLGRDPDAILRDLHAALQHVAHPQLLGHLLHLHRFALVGEGGVAGDDEELFEPGQGRDDILRHAIRDVILGLILAEVLEGQHGDGGPIGQGKGHLLDGGDLRGASGNEGQSARGAQRQ